MSQSPRFAVPAVRVSATPGLVWPALPRPPASDILALLYQLNRSEWWPEDRLRRAQFEQIELLLDHARRTVPFYRTDVAYDVLDSDEALSAETWAKVPILTRGQIQVSGAELHSEAPPASHGGLIPVKTSGSTGMPLKSMKTELTGRFYEAAMLREAIRHRRDWSKRFAAIKPTISASLDPGGEQFDDWGEPFSRFFATGPVFAFNIFADPAEQIRWLRETKPDCILSMPSNTQALARHALAHGLAMPPMLEVRSYGEAYEDDLPRLCREVWGAKHTSIYSSEEIGVIASQCSEHGRYHCESELCLVEVVDDAGRACAPGQIGRVLVTGLHNFAAPLIRYEIGDLAEVGEPCPCGRGLPVLKRILGRTSGQMTLPSGEKRFAEPATSTFMKYTAIVQRQIVQKSPNDIDLLLVVKRRLTGEEEANLFSDLAKRFGAKFNFRTVYVDGIPRTPGGKFQIFRSEIPNG